MAADPTFFWNDEFDISKSVVSFTASSTDVGYAIDNAREADLSNSWKPTDGTSDEWLQVDCGSTSLLGAAGSLAYFAIGYDARSANQTAIKLRYDSADNPAFTSPVALAQFVNPVDTSMVDCDWLGFVIPTPAKRYYRLIQLNVDRGGGTVCAKIFKWAGYKATGLTIMSTDFPGQSPAPWQSRQIFRTARATMAGGLPRFNRYAAPGQRIQIPFGPASKALWQKCRDQFNTIGGPERAIFVQYEGLKNAALADFFLCRLASDSWSGRFVPVNQYDTSDIEMETEPWS